MEFIKYNEKIDFCNQNLKILEKEEAINNIMIGSILKASEEDTRNWLMARLEDNNTIRAIMIINKPKNGLLIYAPDGNLENEECKFIAENINNSKIELKEILSQKENSKNIANSYSKISGKKVKSQKEKYILELGSINNDIKIENLKLIKVEKDIEEKYKNEYLDIYNNVKLFQKETYNEELSDDGIRKCIDIYIDRGLYVLKNNDNEILMQVSTTRELLNGKAIGAVYTPNRHRGKGYAKAGIYLLTQKLLNEGHKVLTMYTSAENKISNHVYEKIGYKRIAEEMLIIFE